MTHEKRKRAPKESQAMVLAFINSCPSFPSHEAIRNHMGWKTREAVTCCLVSLADRGAITMRVASTQARRYQPKYVWSRVE